MVDKVEDGPEVDVVRGVLVGAGLWRSVVHDAVVAEPPVVVRGRKADAGESVPDKMRDIQKRFLPFGQCWKE